jgi:hypothetical protein
MDGRKQPWHGRDDAEEHEDDQPEKCLAIGPNRGPQTSGSPVTRWDRRTWRRIRVD